MSFITDEEKKKARALLSRLSRQEKCEMLSGLDYWRMRGIERLGLPDYWISDGPSGLRKQVKEADYFGVHESVPAICYPAPVTCASTFDPALIERVGQALASDCVEEDVAMVLAPGVNHKRFALGGRNFEYYSEDPLVSTKMGAAMIAGIQSLGVAACVKHFVCNNQETGRMVCDAIVDDKALAEIYLRPFRAIGKETDVAAMMTAYNRLNGVYCTENKALLDLGRSAGFGGAYISDWGAVNDVLKSFQAGLNLEMPGVSDETTTLLERALDEGRWTEDGLDACVLPLLELLVHQAGQSPRAALSRSERKQIARAAAESGIVLLKNENGALPIRTRSVTLVGAFAKHPRIQGTGSSKVNPLEVERLVDVFDHAYYAKGFDEEGKTNEAWCAQAVSLARKSEVVLVCAALPAQAESEGFDRKTLALPEGINEVIRRIAQVHERVVVALACGGPVAMPWLEQVQGVALSYLGGSYGQSALARVLQGRAEAAGRLAETWPRPGLEIPVRTGWKASAYVESVYTGYKYYNGAQVDVLFPFGYGLSYTTFAYSEFERTGRRIGFRVRNTGKRRGSGVVQIYRNDALPFSTQKLLYFEKLDLAPNEEAFVSYLVQDEDLMEYFDGWVLRNGVHQIEVGSSSRAIHHRFLLETDGVSVSVVPAYASAKNVGCLTRSDFARLCGREIFMAESARKPYDQNVCLNDLMEGGWMERTLARWLLKQVPARQGELLQTAPLRILKMNAIDAATRQGLLDLLNGHVVRGARHVDWRALLAFLKENT